MDAQPTDGGNVPSFAVSPDSAEIVESLRELVDGRVADDSLAVHIRSGALFARLKALNRDANAAARAHKQATADARTDMDQTHLGMQNLLYEKRHLEREIDKCHKFASVYQDVPLYTMEQFMELAPVELRTEEVLDSEHQLTLNRLNFELSERQRMDQRKKELEQEKAEMLKQSKAKLAKMDSIKAQIDILVKTANDVQKKVEELAG